MNAEAVYLTSARHLCSRELRSIEEGAYPTAAYYLPQMYRGVKTGLSSPPQRMVNHLFESGDMGIDSNVDPKDQAFIFAAGNGIFSATRLHQKQPGGDFDYASKVPFSQLTQIYAGQLAQTLNATGFIATDSSACASSLKVMMDALSLIRLHGFQRVAILAVEDQVNTGMLEFFGQLRACLSLEQLKDGVLPSAFDEVNQGFVLGQGVAFVWLETETALRSSGRKALARVISAASCGEVCSSAIGQDAAGSGYITAISRALRAAGSSPETVDLIKTHGTGTALNNRAESSALYQIFGKDFRATAYKPAIGHTLGVSGLLETLLAIEDARCGFARAIAHRTTEDEVFLSQDTAFHIRHLLALAAGMGNIFSAAMLEILHD